MSYPNQLNNDRDIKLYKQLFEDINLLGRSRGNVDIEQVERRIRKKFKILAQYPSIETGIENYDYETVLHRSIKVFNLSKIENDDAEEYAQEHGGDERSPAIELENVQKNVLRFIIDTYPKLLYSNRANSTYCCGQTPLHIAISKGNKELVNLLLSNASEKKNGQKGEGLKKMLSQKATGVVFKNNAMMGQLPLSIALLTDNKEIVKLLLNKTETDVYQTNDDGDNLCHSLLKYTNIIPEREDNALKMLKLIKDTRKGLSKRLFLMENIEKETPLILAAKYGRVDLADYIFEEGYPSINISSELVDVRFYDMTDIDHQLKEYTRQQNEKVLRDSAIKVPPTGNGISTPSVFDLIFNHSYNTSLRFMQILPIQWMVRKKWRYYRKYLYIGLLVHIVIMSLLTAAAVERVKSQRPGTINQGLGAPFPAYFTIIMIIISLMYIWLGCFRFVQILRGTFQINFKPFTNPYANAVFHVLFFVFAVCIISDFGATWSTDYNNMLLIIAVVIGWYLFLFFLRATSFFCFFTSLIQRILLQDITRFAPIIVLQLVAFSTAMLLLLHNSNNQGNNSYSSWEGMLMLTFKSFLGVADIEIADSSHPVWLSLIYVAFVIMTIILMLNALIAILSSTCTDLLQNFTRDMHLYLQQLAVILFFEGLLPNKITHKIAKKVSKKAEVDTYDNSTKMFRKIPRHLMRIFVIEDEDTGGITEGNVYPKLLKDIRDIRDTVKDTSQQSSQYNGAPTLKSSISSKGTMANTVDHLDVTRHHHLDIYQHTQKT